MRRLTTYLFALLLLCLTSFACQAEAVTLTDIKIQGDPATQAVNIVLSINQHVPYRAFLLDNPRRVVVDLPRMNWQAPNNRGDASGVIKSYRHGVFQNDTLRLVLDLNQPVKIIKTETVAMVQGKSYRYIIHLQPTNSAGFNQSLNQVVQATAPAEADKTVSAVTTTRVTETVTIAPPVTSGAGTAKKLIVLDPGHGGVDPGAIATNGVYEKNITLSTARELKRQLEASGRYRVKMTRDSDVFIKLQDRVKIARQAKADLFISMHADTISRPAVQGSSVYTLSNQASDAEAARLAERENQVDALVGGVNLGTQDKEVADILLDLVVRDNMNQSKILADTVVTSLRRGGVQTLQGSHRFAGFAVLKAPDIPSILIEMGYLSNPTEAQLLNTQAHRERIARAVMGSVDMYFNETSKKTEF